MAAVGAYAWDSSRSDEIADGVTIGGVDVGGMNADEATEAVETELVKPLRKKITVTYDGVKYQLSAEKLEVDSDVDGMVDRALEESQEGGLPTRVWRYATGGEVDVAISPQVSYSSNAIDEFIGKVADRGQPRPGQRDDRADHRLARGRRRPRRDHRRRVGAATADRVRGPAPRPPQVAVPVDVVHPDVTKADLAAAVPDLPDRRPVELHRDPVEGPRAGRRSTRSRSGQPAYPTPTGLYSIESKQVDPVWSVPNSPWAGELGGSTVAGGTRGEPAQGALDGHHRRRRLPRHRRGRLARHRGLARLRADGGSGRRSTLYDQVAGRHPGLHRLRRLPQAFRCAGRRGGREGEATAHGLEQRAAGAAGLRASRRAPRGRRRSARTRAS